MDLKKLEDLKKLLDSNAINNKEYEKLKRQLIENISGSKPTNANLKDVKTLNPLPTISPPDREVLTLDDIMHSKYALNTTYGSKIRKDGGYEVYNVYGNWEFIKDEVKETGGGAVDIEGRSVKNIQQLINSFNNKQLAKIKIIYAKNNNITDFSGIEKLKNLEELDVSHNKISKIPKELTSLKLKKLNLSNNNIVVLENLPIVEEVLDLNNNQIEEIPKYFSEYIEKHMCKKTFLLNNSIKKSSALNSLSINVRGLLKHEEISAMIDEAAWKIGKSFRMGDHFALGYNDYFNNYDDEIILAVKKIHISFIIDNVEGLTNPNIKTSYRKSDGWVCKLFINSSSNEKIINTLIPNEYKMAQEMNTNFLYKLIEREYVLWIPGIWIVVGLIKLFTTELEFFLNNHFDGGWVNRLIFIVALLGGLYLYGWIYAKLHKRRLKELYKNYKKSNPNITLDIADLAARSHQIREKTKNILNRF